MTIPLLFLGDSPDCLTGLGRITRDLALLASKWPEFRVATLGRGGIGSSKLPFAQYNFDPIRQWGEGYIESVWNDFAGKERGIVFSIWDASRLFWFSCSEYLEDGDLRNFLTGAPFQRWGYFPVDAIGPGPGGALSELSSKTVNGYNRVLAYTKFGRDILEKSGAQGYVDFIPHGIDSNTFKPRDKHAGRMALGIGDDVTLIGCVAEGSKILMADGTEKCIELISVGDIVQSGGVPGIVTALKPSKYVTTLVNIVAQGLPEPLSVTSEHPILVVKREKVLCHKYPSMTTERSYACRPWYRDGEPCGSCGEWRIHEPDWIPEFVPASELVVGDFAAIPIMKQDNGCTFLAVKDHTSFTEAAHTTYKTPEVFELTDDFLFTVGLWAAEGSILFGGWGLDFTFHKKETYLVDRIKLALEPYGYKLKIYTYEDYDPKRNTMSVKVSGKGLAALMESLAGRGAHNKRFSKWVMELPPELQRHILAGFSAGDGHFMQSTGVWSLCTVSRDLAYGLWRMCLRSGIPANWYHTNNQYGGRYNVVYSMEDREVDRDNRRNLIFDGYYLTPITAIVEDDEGSMVFDMTVSETHRYIANGFCVHNCNMANQARKDWGLWAEVASMLPDVHWWLQIDVRERYWSLPALISDFKLEGRVHFGRQNLDDTDLSYYYSACDLTILPSLGEGFGYPIAESLACGVPVVHHSYAGGSDVVGEEAIKVIPTGLRLDTINNVYRPTFTPEQWVAAIRAQIAQLDEWPLERCRASVEHLFWSNLAPVFRNWFMEGIS